MFPFQENSATGLCFPGGKRTVEVPGHNAIVKKGFHFFVTHCFLRVASREICVAMCTICLKLGSDCVIERL